MKKGFTLIELLFTMAIISIIAGIGITQMSGSTATAENTSAKAELRNAITEAQMFYTNQATATGNGTYSGWSPKSSKVTLVDSDYDFYCIEAQGADGQVYSYDSDDSEIGTSGC